MFDRWKYSNQDIDRIRCGARSLPVSLLSLKNSCCTVVKDPIESEMLPDRTFEEMFTTSMFFKAYIGFSVPGSSSSKLYAQAYALLAGDIVNHSKRAVLTVAYCRTSLLTAYCRTMPYYDVPCRYNA